ncbi:MAG: alpha/beta hydrolase [Pseudonocardia sp.]|nr:alpha/beta hydrolase [Pseudonocardia sp.]
MYLHGGAYVLGPVAAQWRWAAALGEAASTAVVVIGYRMAPDHPHPAALDDAVAAVVALQDDGTLAAGRWALAGDSAGGGLALAVLQRAHLTP